MLPREGQHQAEGHMELGIAGRVAIVTGGSRGIGRAVAERLCREGASVALCARTPESLAEAGRALEVLGGPVLALEADLTEPAAAARVVEATAAAWGRIDILVNNAGILGPYMSAIELPEDVWDRLIAVHLKGTFLCCKAVLPIMKSQGKGRIVNMASVAGKEGNANMVGYSAAKAGIIALTKSLGKEMAKDNVFVNCVTPGLIETDMAIEIAPERRAISIAAAPMGRLGRPEEVAAVVKFLASDEASFVTGQCYDVSGGRSVF